MDVIFSEQLMELYNAVFQFLLQVKMAKWCLDEIRIGRKLCARVDTTFGHCFECMCARLLVVVSDIYLETCMCIVQKINPLDPLAYWKGVRSSACLKCSMFHPGWFSVLSWFGRAHPIPYTNYLL